MLRGWRDDDLDGLAAMNADPEVMRNIHDGHVHDRAEAAASLERIRTQWAEHGFGLWAVERKPDGVFVGFCGIGFPRFMPELAASPEIGWRLMRAHWNNGYATEAAIASRDDFFRTFDFDHVVSIAYPANIASHRVMEKVGLRRVADARLPSGAAVWVHRLDRADWRPA